jgi:hypothetical protein
MADSVLSYRVCVCVCVCVRARAPFGFVARDEKLAAIGVRALKFFFKKVKTNNYCIVGTPTQPLVFGHNF